MASTWPSPGLAGLMPSSLLTPCTVIALSMACCLCMVPLVSALLPQSAYKRKEQSTPFGVNLIRSQANTGCPGPRSAYNTDCETAAEIGKQQMAASQHPLVVLIMARQHCCKSVSGWCTRQVLSVTQMPYSGQSIYRRLCFQAGCSNQAVKHAWRGLHLFPDIHVSVSLMLWLFKSFASGCATLCNGCAVSVSMLAGSSHI